MVAWVKKVNLLTRVLDYEIFILIVQVKFLDEIIFLVLQQ